MQSISLSFKFGGKKIFLSSRKQIEKKKNEKTSKNEPRNDIKRIVSDRFLGCDAKTPISLPPQPPKLMVCLST